METRMATSPWKIAKSRPGIIFWQNNVPESKRLLKQIPNTRFEDLKILENVIYQKKTFTF